MTKQCSLRFCESEILLVKATNSRWQFLPLGGIGKAVPSGKEETGREN